MSRLSDYPEPTQRACLRVAGIMLRQAERLEREEREAQEKKQAERQPVAAA